MIDVWYLCIWVVYGLKIKYYLSVILRISHKKIDLNGSTYYIVSSSYQQHNNSTNNFVIVNQMAGKTKSSSSKSKSGSKGKSGGGSGAGVKQALSAHNNPAARLRIPQTVGLPGQIANNAGGFSFPLPIEQEWMRYLIIGSKSENGNFYQTGGQIATHVARCIMAAVDNPTTYKQLLCDLVDVSVKGRAAKQEMTMMALAAAIAFAPNPECKSLALDAIGEVCRIPTHWFMLLQFIRGISQDKAKPGKGMGKGVRKAFTNLYTSRTGPELAVLLTKYKNREGWTHNDVISLLHINPAEMKDDGGRLVLEWFMKKDKPERKNKDGVTVPASFERTEFLKRLQAIPTPIQPQQQQQQQQQPFVGASSVAAVSGGEKVCVHFNIISGPMAGEDDVALKIGMNEPLANLAQTFADIGAGAVEFRFNTNTLGPKDTVADLIKQGFDVTKRKIYVKAAPATSAAAAPATSAAAAPATSKPEVGDEPKAPREKEDPLVGTARFLKALIELAKTGATKDAATALRVMRDVRRIQREHLPTELLSLPTIWSALLDELGVMALVRNLNKLSSTGVANTRGGDIVRMLCDPKRITDSKIHPFAVLVALKTYGKGCGDLGSSTWPVNSAILLAMSTTFKLSFGNVPRTGKRIMLALDVSGSMSGAYCAGSTTVNCREGSIAMAMATLHAEGAANTQIYAFTTTFRNMNGRIKPEMSIDAALLATNDVFGGTDCALPMTEAMKLGLKIDAFIVYTDSETYAPTIHPQVALEQYRKQSGIDAKLIVVGMASNCLSIADHKDQNTLNLSGFDTSTPNLISMFINGEL